MAKQAVVLAFIIFFAVVGMAAAQDNNHPAAGAGAQENNGPAAAAAAREKNITAAAASLAPAAARAGLNITNASQLLGALGAVAKGAPIEGPIPEGLLKHLAPRSDQPTKSAAVALQATAAVGATVAAGVFGSFFL